MQNGYPYSIVFKHQGSCFAYFSTFSVKPFISLSQPRQKWNHTQMNYEKESKKDIFDRAEMWANMPLQILSSCKIFYFVPNHPKLL